MFSSLLGSGNPVRGLKRSAPEGRSRLDLTPLEDRLTPYALAGSQWADTNISFSYMPDGTQLDGGYTSALFQHVDALIPTAAWQREYARALQSWAQHTPLNFHLVSDNGSPMGTTGSAQGDSRFGDIRAGARAMDPLGFAWFPSTSTRGGDVTLSTSYGYQIGSVPDFYAVVLHETGHSLGLGHSAVSNSVMSGAYNVTATGLFADDIAGIQAIYGARRHDAYDTGAGNNSLGAATALTLSSGGANVRADLTNLTDVDYYRVVASGSSLSVTVDARNLSLLAPKVLAYDAAGDLLGSAAADYGQAATLDLTGLTAGQTYYLVADGATADVFGIGGYSLIVTGGGASPVSPPAAPSGLTAVAGSSSQISLSWQDNAGDEGGFRVERSTDGVSFTPAGTAGADATSHTVTGLTAGTTYYFRVRAYNTGGDSPWSNTAQATTPTAPPPSGLSPDRFESNDTATTARDLGKFNSTTQTALTVHSAADVDWLAFTANSSGTFTLSIAFGHTAGNLDLYVLDTQQRMLGSGTSAASAGGEAVTYSLARGTRYYIKVTSPEGGVNTYDLSVAKVGKAGGGGGGGFLVLGNPWSDTPTTGDGSALDRPLPGCGCPMCAGTATPSPVADGVGQSHDQDTQAVEFTPASNGLSRPLGRPGDGFESSWSQASRLLLELELPFRDGSAYPSWTAGAKV